MKPKNDDETHNDDDSDEVCNDNGDVRVHGNQRTAAVS